MKLHPWMAACALAGGLSLNPGAARTPSVEGPPGVAATPAPQAGATITLAAALDLAWQRAVSARETEAQQRHADARGVTASRPWSAPPTLELGYRTDRLNDNAGSREIEAGVAVPLWLPGQRDAAMAMARGAVTQADAAVQAARLRLAGEVREAAWSVVALEAEALQAEALVSAHRRLADDVDRRVQAGDLARADALVARAEQLATQAQHAEVLQRLQLARTRWQQLIGGAWAPDSDEPRAAAGRAETLGDEHPELQLSRRATEHARQRLELVRHSRRGSPELSVGLRQEAPGRGEVVRGSVVVGVRLPFGTDDRNRPLEAEALGELDVARTAEARLRERLDAELSSARAALESTRTRLDAESARARLLRERATLIEKSFRAGETPLPDLLRTLTAAAEADAAVTRQTAALGLARARLQQALGLLP